MVINNIVVCFARVDVEFCSCSNAIFGHLVILVLCEKLKMWHEIARGKDCK